MAPLLLPEMTKQHAKSKPTYTNNRMGRLSASPKTTWPHGSNVMTMKHIKYRERKKTKTNIMVTFATVTNVPTLL